MNTFARFDENPAMTLQDIKKKTLGTDRRTHGRMHAHTDNGKTVYPPQTKFAGGIITSIIVYVVNHWNGVLSVYHFYSARAYSKCSKIYFLISGWFSGLEFAKRLSD